MLIKLVIDILVCSGNRIPIRVYTIIIYSTVLWWEWNHSLLGSFHQRFRCYIYIENRFRSEFYYDTHVQLLTVNRRSLLTKNCQYLSDRLHCKTETLIINRMLEGSMLRDSKQFCNLIAKNRERCWKPLPPVMEDFTWKSSRKSFTNINKRLPRSN